MTDIPKLCDEIEALRKARDSHEPGTQPWLDIDIMYNAALHSAAQPLIDAARESVKLRERIKELEQQDELARRLAELDRAICPCGNPADSKESRALCSAGTCYGCLSDRLAEAERESVKKDERIKELEQELKERGVRVAKPL